MLHYDELHECVWDDARVRTRMKKVSAGRARRCTESELKALAMRMLRQQLTVPSECWPSSLITCTPHQCSKGQLGWFYTKTENHTKHGWNTTS